MRGEIVDLGDVVGRITEFSPLLLMGQAVREFKDSFDFPIRRVTNIAEVKDLVSYYFGISSLSHPLVVEDLSLLAGSSGASFFLLKLVEEAKFPVVLLSLYDRVPSVILSRVKMVIKRPFGAVSSELASPSSVFKMLDSDEGSYYEHLSRVVKLSPLFYFYESNIVVRRNREKIISILG